MIGVQNRRLINDGAERDLDAIEGEDLLPAKRSAFGERQFPIVCNCPKCNGRTWTVAEIREHYPAVRDTPIYSRSIGRISTMTGHAFAYVGAEPAGKWKRRRGGKLLPHGGRSLPASELPAPREALLATASTWQPVNPNGPGILGGGVGLPRFPGGGTTIKAYEAGYRFDTGGSFAPREVDLVGNR